MIYELIQKKIERFGFDSLYKFELHALYAYELIKDGCDRVSAMEIMRDVTQTEFIKKQLKETFGYGICRSDS